MKDLRTSYLGLQMTSPVLVAASPISSRIDAVKRAEEAGAGALVIRSLFEEQILLEREELEVELSTGADSFAEALSYFPELPHGDAKEHLAQIGKIRAAVTLPLIASLNAIKAGSWTSYARQLQEAGADAIELNLYSVATDPEVSSAEIEEQLLDTFEAVQAAVTVPIAVKLGPWFTSVAHLVNRLSQRGASAVVLFNRFLQPDIDPHRMTLKQDMGLSSREEMRLALRWTGILAPRVKTEICLNTGIQSGQDVIAALLAGAVSVQVAGVLIRHGVSYISTMLRAMELWMDERGFQRIDEFRGLLDQKHVSDPFTFERAQYVGMLRSRSS